MSQTKDNNMPFMEHLSELRTCLMHVCGGIALCALLSYAWANEIFSILSSPIRENFTNVDLIGTGPAEAFIVKLKASAVFGALLSSPYTFLKIWHFIAPGLYENERKQALPFVFFSTFFFIAGVSFCFLVILPFAFGFFETEFESIGISPKIKIGEYLSFTIKLLFVFGLAFEMPVLTFLLSKLNVITSKWLIQKFRYAVIFIFVSAAILTPPDVITQVLLAIPLILLYGLCILIARYNEKQRLEPSE